MPWSSWTSLWGVASYMQGYDPHAKQSTRYLARGSSITSCATDLSQYATNLTAGTSVVYESGTTRFNRGEPRTIGLAVAANNTDTGTLYRHGTGGNLELLQFSSANTIRVYVNNTLVLTYTVTGLGASRDDLIIAWISEANPDTTGASDAVQSWLLVWNTTDGTFDRTRFAHATKTLQSTTAYWGANDSIGTSAFTGTITELWFESRCQSATEIAVDRVETRSEPSSVVEQDSEHQGIPVTPDTIDSRNYHHGPSLAWAAAATRALYRRTLSPLVNERCRVVPAWTASLLTGGDPFIRTPPGATGWAAHLGWLHAAPVSETCTHAWVRVHVRSAVSSGAAVPIGVRLYSHSRPPGSLDLAVDAGSPEPLESYYLEQQFTRDETGGLGEYTVMGLVPIARGVSGVHEGMTYFSLALRVDPASASANDAAETITVRSIHVVPCVRESAGGLPFAESIA
ncbi:MAG: hypothetical protein IPH07_23955 [Deltaproteobacteria bacterium]|nr:hypothetical protein [Deltaproteobacteria bacterium]